MLVLARQPGERIKLFLPDGAEITIEVVRIGALGARIGIDAPRAVMIAREELLAAPAPSADPAAEATIPYSFAG